LYGAPLSETITPDETVLDTIDEHTEAENREQAKVKYGKDPTWDQRIAQRRLEVIRPYGEGAPLRRNRYEEQQPRTYHGSAVNPDELVRQY